MTPDVGDFRLLDRRVADALNRLPERNRYVRGLIRWLGFRHTEVRYKRAERFAGETKYPYTKLVRLALDGVTAFSTLPLQLVTYLGFAVSGLSVLLVVYALLGRVSGGHTPAGWTSVFVAVAFLSGCSSSRSASSARTSSRIFEEVKGRPLYVDRRRHRRQYSECCLADAAHVERPHGEKDRSLDARPFRRLRGSRRPLLQGARARIRTASGSPRTATSTTRGWLGPMKALLAELREKLAPRYAREELAGAKVFRIHRDVRFSKDKAPYKTHIGGYLGIEGSGAGPRGAAALYVHVAPDELFACAGSVHDGRRAAEALPGGGRRREARRRGRRHPAAARCARDSRSGRTSSYSGSRAASIPSIRRPTCCDGRGLMVALPDAGPCAADVAEARRLARGARQEVGAARRVARRR